MRGSSQRYPLAHSKLLRCKRTKAFLTPDGPGPRTSGGLYASEPSEAKKLSQPLNLEEAEIYYSFDEESTSQWDFALPLHQTSDLKAEVQEQF